MDNVQIVNIFAIFITPIFKSGPRNNVGNYSPVAIISVIPKIIDKVMYNKILKICLETISEKQHGFVPGRSTITNLTLFTNSIFSSFNRNNQLCRCDIFGFQEGL